MRIGLTSLVGDGFGTGSFVVESLPSVAGFPAAGTILSTQYLLRPINDGGSYVTDPNGSQYANAMHTVYQLADGSGGSYLDWATSVFANYITNGEQIVTLAENNTLSYYDVAGNIAAYVWQTFDTFYYHDGQGGYYTQQQNVNTQPAGALIVSGLIDLYNNLAYPNELGGEGLHIDFLTYSYRHDGSGNYYQDYNDNQSVPYPYGTPLNSPAWGGINPYPYSVLVADAGYGYNLGFHHDGTLRNFLADGSGGYFVTMHTASYFADGTLIDTFGNQDTEVHWNGSGGYYVNTN